VCLISFTAFRGIRRRSTKHPQTGYVLFFNMANNQPSHCTLNSIIQDLRIMQSKFIKDIVYTQLMTSETPTKIAEELKNISKSFTADTHANYSTNCIVNLLTRCLFSGLILSIRCKSITALLFCSLLRFCTTLELLRRQIHDSFYSSFSFTASRGSWCTFVILSIRFICVFDFFYKHPEA
jgi:hypothetical protein